MGVTMKPNHPLFIFSAKNKDYIVNGYTNHNTSSFGMKGFRFLCLLLLAAAATVAFMCHGSNADWSSTVKNRKLRDFVDEDDRVQLEDYRPINPVPSSKARIRPGTIHHGTPLMPYIPKHAPPPRGQPPKRDRGGG